MEHAPGYPQVELLRVLSANTNGLRMWVLMTPTHLKIGQRNNAKVLAESREAFDPEP